MRLTALPSIKLGKLLDHVTTAAVLVGTAALLWSQFGAAPAVKSPRPTRELPPLPKQPLSVAGAPALGRGDSPVVLVEYSEMQCPFCQRFEKGVWPQFKQEFVDTGKVLVYFRHLPLEKLHPLAFPAASALECAATRGRFWPMKDRLIGTADGLDLASLKAAAAAEALDPDWLEACMASEGAAAVRASLAESKVAGVNSTPTFLIGRRRGDSQVEAIDRIIGAQPIETFRDVIGRAMAKIKTMRD